MKPEADYLGPVRAFLHCETPGAWLDWALANESLLLIDHANCEKKAAATALALIHRYTRYPRLLQKLSRLAREELRHFEQVLAIMSKRKIEYLPVRASRYAAGLHEAVRREDPGRLVDSLVVGAVIEARSCERFAALAPALDPDLQAFYLSLLKSEARHFEDYLGLAAHVSNGEEVARRQEAFCRLDAELVTSTDEQFRFHSGIPVENIAVNH